MRNKKEINTLSVLVADETCAIFPEANPEESLQIRFQQRLRNLIEENCDSSGSSISRTLDYDKYDSEYSVKVQYYVPVILNGSYSVTLSGRVTLRKNDDIENFIERINQKNKRLESDATTMLRALRGNK